MLTALLNTTVDVRTTTPTKTATGFASEGASSVRSAGVRCRVTDPSPEQAVLVYGTFDRNQQKRVYFDTDQALSLNDILVWQSPSGDEWTLYVHSVMNQGGNLNRLWAVDCATYPYSGQTGA